MTRQFHVIFGLNVVYTVVYRTLIPLWKKFKLKVSNKTFSVPRFTNASSSSQATNCKIQNEMKQNDVSVALPFLNNMVQAFIYCFCVSQTFVISSKQLSDPHSCNIPISLHLQNLILGALHLHSLHDISVQTHPSLDQTWWWLGTRQNTFVHFHFQICLVSRFLCFWFLAFCRKHISGYRSCPPKLLEWKGQFIFFFSL